ncbi:fumarate hydratase C-terminal domain-containing protein [Acetonema longum]|uniref:Fe-S type hydro-lyase tartrate/fumarate beta region n=1 Tax=Acetonema longum DSM 6540 TaxID=1009370 RepID=F7NJU3_9FIRM|nr:fumarate hydratase C-terminal domain-containing protein [Acetonema longum]EGO63675.1 Fe-S type hydro-lyase tartrate/fumarate beta region [Acetonema longum DSM 6540]
MQITTPISQAVIDSLKIYDQITLTGIIYAGRDAVLPKIVRLYEQNKLAEAGLDLRGTVVLHTAVSVAGIGPTSSNKLEIEGSIPLLSKAGVKIHLGKGSLSQDTVRSLQEHGSVFAVTPPTTALFNAKMRRHRVAAYPEEGIEAFHELEVVEFPAIVAIAHGQSIFKESEA